MQNKNKMKGQLGEENKGYEISRQYSQRERNWWTWLNVLQITEQTKMKRIEENDWRE